MKKALVGRDIQFLGSKGEIKENTVAGFEPTSSKLAVTNVNH